MASCFRLLGLLVLAILILLQFRNNLMEALTGKYSLFLFLFSSYLLQLNVFFEELNYEVIEEHMGYGVNV